MTTYECETHRDPITKVCSKVCPHYNRDYSCISEADRYRRYLKLQEMEQLLIKNDITYVQDGSIFIIDNTYRYTVHNKWSRLGKSKWYPCKSLQYFLDTYYTEWRTK